ncbi:MAG: phosphohydrolase [Bacteroidetes bacterium HGW-Bacteroidetes-16]|jgi:hypothetical protein|nr:MAG: phosphohydrolase [Bacteroidetes bacterium HGW-Bacteroidetes-16]
MVNKRKILNDPVYGFISIPDGLLFDLIEHPWFQRLRRIKQLGLTHLVYPGALHTRFHHSLGAMYLMKRAIEELRSKGHEITKEEALASYVAILLHDIGHGPYSHTLEHSIADGVNHEYLSKLLMMRLNDEFGGKLTEAIQVFDGTHPKAFLHKLVSSQLDMDRLDYLKRDSFFSGVSEGTVNYERILNMLDVVDDNLVIEAKGIYSVEKFIMARRLMYWQVYLHKTVLVAEHTLMHVLRRAKELRMQGTELFATPALDYFLKQHVTKELFLKDEHALTMFTLLDDFDIFTSMKVWTTHPDKVLRLLSQSVVNRRLFKIEMQSEPFNQQLILEKHSRVMEKWGLTDKEADNFVFSDSTSNYMYHLGSDNINILFKDGTVMDIAEASDQLNISLLAKPTTKYFLCYPKGLG